MEERRVESYLRKQIGLLGGICFKFVSPGNAGVPDRIVLLPAPPRIAFVELKAEGGVLSPRQMVQIGRIKALGFRVEVLEGMDQVRIFLDSLKGGGRIHDEVHTTRVPDQNDSEDTQSE